ncbi:MAG: YdeI/OmpD-associated family protein [Pseudomonadota bacterium]
MPLPDGFETIEVKSTEALWAWLGANHAVSDSVILITWKKHHPAQYVDRDAVLDALVAYGWIDGRRYTVDDDHSGQLIARRKVQHWAASYKTRAENLEKDGRMRPPGRASVEDGKRNGLWDFMDDVDALIVPDDLGTALGASRSSWDALAPSYRRNVLRWIKLAKTEPTRAKRIVQAAGATKSGEKLAQM